MDPERAKELIEMQRLLLEEPFTRPYLPRTQGDEEALPPLVLELALRKLNSEMQRQVRLTFSRQSTQVVLAQLRTLREEQIHVQDASATGAQLASLSEASDFDAYLQNMDTTRVPKPIIAEFTSRLAHLRSLDQGERALHQRKEQYSQVRDGLARLVRQEKAKPDQEDHLSTELDRTRQLANRLGYLLQSTEPHEGPSP